MTAPDDIKKVPGNGSDSRSGIHIPDLCAGEPVVAMILLAQLLVLVHVLARSSLTAFDWELFVVCTLFVIWVILCSALALCRIQQALGRLKPGIAIAIVLSLVAMITYISSIAAQKLLEPLTSVDQTSAWIARNVVVSIIIAAIVLRYFTLQQQLRLRENMAVQARLDALRARIRPHFLFNTLNSIASLIDAKPQAAERAVEDLAELFRASLKESTQVVSVDDEIRTTKLYLGIEELRLEGRLIVDWDIDPSSLDGEIPSLILQPLVENAVYHGVARLPQGGTIHISIQATASQLLMRVENPVPETPGYSGGTQVAQSNIRQRLEAIYGDEAALSVAESKDNYRVDIVLPNRPFL